MHVKLRLTSFATVAIAALAGPALADETKVLEGPVPMEGPDHFFIPFEVPEGTAEIEIRDVRADKTNVLDRGLDDPKGYRGWGGGTSEPSIVGPRAASRAYVPGPLVAGTWRIVVGKARIEKSPPTYKYEVVLKTAATLADQNDRAPYKPRPAVKTERRWYAGDFHVHSRESTDADKVLEEIPTYAKSHGLDFVVVTDHNTVTQLDYFEGFAQKYPEVLLIPGNELTTYQGHSGALGTTKWLDHRIGQPGVTIEKAIDAIHAEGGLFAINHPAIDIGSICIGCAWKLPVPPSKLDALEIQNLGVDDGGGIFVAPTFAFWESYLDKGAHVTALGGSDDHSAGTYAKYGELASPIGSPLTLVYADELSVKGILDAVKKGRTVVKMESVRDPMLELTSEVVPDDTATIHARSTRLRVRVSGGGGREATVRWVKTGQAMDEIDVTADPFETTLDVRAPAAGEDRYRAEVLINGIRRTVTSHVFVKLDPNGPDLVTNTPPKPSDDGGLEGGGCASAPGGARGEGVMMTALFAIALVVVRRRRG